MFKDPNTVALVTLIATVAGLAIAVFTHQRSLNRSELSKIRDSLVNRLEVLSNLRELKNRRLLVSERELILGMHIKVIELEISKYLVLAQKSNATELKEPLQELMIFDVETIISNSPLFRKRCYKLLSSIDKAYFHEIQSSYPKLSDAQTYYTGIGYTFLASTTLAMLYLITSLIF